MFTLYVAGRAEPYFQTPQVVHHVLASDYYDETSLTDEIEFCHCVLCPAELPYPH
jgi:hypothetical protein